MPIYPTSRHRRAAIPPAALAGALAPLVLSGCSDPKAASKENFQNALAAFSDKNCAMLTPASGDILVGSGPMSFPVDVTIALVAEVAAPCYAAFAAAGLLKRGTEKTTQGLFGQATKAVSDDLTDKGRPLWKAPNSLGPGSPGGFCAGHIRVVAVDRFIDPGVANNAKVSRVTFTARAEYDAWTKTPAVQAAFRAKLRHTQPVSQTLPLVMMNDGWAAATSMPTQ